MKKITLLLVMLALFLLPVSFVLAKGNFAYLAVKGQGIQGEMTLSDPVFTEDFFAFANFATDQIPEPTYYDSDISYEISRFELVDTKPIVFDELIYYPDQGYVYYVGINGGSSEYDGKWFTANPAIERPFREALSDRASVDWIAFAIFIPLAAAFIFAFYYKPKKKE